MFTPQSFCASCFLILCLLSPALAQVAPPATVEQPAGQLTSTSIVTASATAERVRFTAPNTVVQMHLQVYDNGGQLVFDVSSKGNVLDWTLQDSGGARLNPGSYLSVVTVKSISGKLSQRIGSVSVQEKQLQLERVDATQMTGAQQQAVGPVEDNSALTILQAGETEAATVVAHDGTQGQINRSRGALSFRLGDFFSGKDTEQMRLTEEGNLGIGTDNPQAKLDVAGVIRTSKGIEFENGTKLTATATGSLQQTLADGTVVPNATGSGTQNKLAKWADSAGTLGDSVVTEASGNIGIGTPTPQAALHVIGNQFLKPVGATPTYEVLAGSDPTTTVMLTTDSAGFGWQIAPSNVASETIVQVLGQFFAAVPNRGEFGVYLGADSNSAFKVIQRGGPELIRVNRAGNVGIGSSSPGGKLQVATTNDTSPTSITTWDARHFVIGGGASSSGGIGLSYNQTNNVGYIEALSPSVAWRNLALQSGGGNVGIGTITPTSVLHVMGTQPPPAGIAPGLDAVPVLQVIGAKGGNAGIGNAGAGAPITLQSGEGGTPTIGKGGVGGTVTIQAGSGGPSFGDNGGNGGSVVIQAGNGNSSQSNVGGIGGSITLQPGTAGGSTFGSAGTAGNVLVAPSDGNVGIGTNTPQAKLSVVALGASEIAGSALSIALRSSAGTLSTTAGAELPLASMGFQAQGNNVSLGVRAIRATGGSGWTTTAIGLAMDVDNLARAAGGTALWFHSNGNVGIGTSSPAHRLEVSGGGFGANALVTDNNSSATTLDLGNTSTGGKTWRLQSVGVDITGRVGNFEIWDAGTGFNVFTIQPDGKVGIGTTGPDQKLSVNGDASKLGSGSWQTFSDERLKTIKGRFIPGLKALMQLQPVRYEYKPENALGLRSSGEHIGFGAQAVQKIIPEAVSKTDKGYLLVNNDPILWTMLNAIKEQQQEIQVQRLRAEQQQQQLQEKHARIEKLEARLAALETVVKNISVRQRPRR